MLRSKYFSDRLGKLISMDEIRLLKFLEFFQYTIIYVLLSIIISSIIKYILNYFIDDKNDKKDENDKKDKKEKNDINKFFKNIVLLILYSYIILLSVFYIRKIGLLFPSISNLINPKYRLHTTIETTFHISVFIIFIELLPRYRIILDNINDYLH